MTSLVEHTVSRISASVAMKRTVNTIPLTANDGQADNSSSLVLFINKYGENRAKLNFFLIIGTKIILHGVY